MKYRKILIILIINLISLGQILLSYIANTSHMRACTHAHMHTRAHACMHTRAHTHRHHRRTGYCYSEASNRDGPRRLRQYRSLAIKINTRAGDPNSRGFGCFLRIKKLLGRTETRTHDRMYYQTKRTVRDISRDDRARIATCSLRTPTDRQTDLRRIIVL